MSFEEIRRNSRHHSLLIDFAFGDRKVKKGGEDVVPNDLRVFIFSAGIELIYHYLVDGQGRLRNLYRS